MLKKEPFLLRFPPYLKLMSLIVIIIICLFIFNLLGFGISMLIWGKDGISTANISFAKFMQIVNELGVFIFPVILFAYLANKDVKRYLKIGRKPKMFSLFTAVLLMYVSIPLTVWLTSINEAMHLPSFMAGIENWMQAQQKANDLLSDNFLKDTSKSGLLINIIMIAILPAIGEELLFRGALIKLFKSWFHNVHIAIIITAIIFSAIHIQFFGFFPRLVLGIILGYLFVYSRNLWVPITAHLVNNATAVMLVYLNTKNIIKVDPDTLGISSTDYIVIIGSFAFVLILMFALYKSRRKIRPHHSERRHHSAETDVEMDDTDI